ncbi:MAG: electron transfer flavoprotein subunit alpha/FixB family protein [Tetrasphaera sp.]|jgi:electron transfer flavoprotein alpha subunit|nr:electron transfer flavoprotein subunit alpha/FixB family protein [Tetrasphaera sp.]
MADVFVLVDHANGAVRKTTAELLTMAARLGNPVAIFVGSGVEQAQPILARFGASRVFAMDNADVAGHLVAPQAELLAALVKKFSPAAVLIPANPAGKEIAARLAVKTDSGLITDAVDVQATGEGIEATQSVFAGSYTITGKVTKGTPIIAVKPNSAAPEEKAGAAQVVPVNLTISEAGKGAKISESKPRVSTGRPELNEAAIIISGGRGTSGNFGPVESFADSLGAAVGASRAAVDAGWYPHTAQIGQTGKQVSPQLYVAAGISGAIQHRAGMQTSKTIVAVNKDPEAPIFELVDFGVVGDLFQVLPQATDAVNAAKG